MPSYARFPLPTPPESPEPGLKSQGAMEPDSKPPLTIGAVKAAKAQVSVTVGVTNTVAATSVTVAVMVAAVMVVAGGDEVRRQEQALLTLAAGQVVSKAVQLPARLFFWFAVRKMVSVAAVSVTVAVSVTLSKMC